MLTRDDIQNVLPLSPLQEGMLFHALRQNAGDAQPYVLQFRISLVGALNADAFHAAWNALIARHEALRTVFRAVGADRPMQLVLRQADAQLRWIEGPDTRPDAVDALAHDEQLAGFDLSHAPPMRILCVRLDHDRTEVIWTFHHIILDGWCIGLLHGELATLYAMYCAGQQPSLPPVPGYSRFIAWLGDHPAADTLGFWRRELDGVRSPPMLPGHRDPSARHQAPRRMQSCQLLLDTGTSDLLRRHAAGSGTTIGALLQCLWGILLGRLNDSDDVVFASVVALRPPSLPGSDAIVGLCINTLPLRIRFAWDRSLADALGRTRDGMADWMEHAHGALADILAQPHLRGFALNHLLAVENYPVHAGSEFAPGIAIEAVQARMPNSFDLSLNVFLEPALRVVFSYDATAFQPDAVPGLAARFERLLRIAALGLDRTVGSIDLTEAGERQTIQQSWSRGAVLQPLLSVAAARRAVLAGAADRPALFHAGRTLTHVELERESLCLARDLAAWGGLLQGACIAIAAPVSERFCVAMLACLRLGIAIVPLDPDTPRERLLHTLHDCAAVLLLIDGRDPLPDAAPRLPRFDLATWSAGGHAPEPADATTDAAAYVIYTSGTTGLPKGVRIGQASLLNYASWLQATGWFDSATRAVLLNPPWFDLGYTALFGALLLGGAVALPTEADRRDPARAIRTIVEYRADFLKLAPSYLHALLEHPDAGLLSQAPLRTVLLGGEEHRIDDLRRLRSLCPGVQLVNHYGPTETTIGCIAGPVRQDVLDGSMSPQRIGRPIANTRVLICDRSGQPMPPASSGEILVGGVALAQGYVDTAAEAERFVTLEGERFYRTGDYGMWLADGQILFLGRRDDQVKVRGFRVSTREVEALLRDTGEVLDAAVLARREPDGDVALAAYVVLADPAGGDPRRLREKLSAHAPAHLLPATIVPVSRLPLTANGKIDRAALALKPPPRPVAQPTRPGNAIEEQLRDIWCDVLFLDEVGLDDDFFLLGGHSLKAVRVLSRVRRRIGADLAIRDLFEYRTIRALAQRLSAGAAEPSRTLRLRDDGAKARVLFLLPPTLGTATAYKEMVDLLPAPLTVHGLQCRGFDRAEPFHASIAAIAEEFAASIRSIRPDGPYRLAGWSLGARFALDTARVLEQQGARVRLCLLDWSPRGMVPAPREPLRFEAMRALPYWGRVIDELRSGLAPADLRRIEALAGHLDTLAGTTACPGGLHADILCLEASGNESPADMHKLRGLTDGLFRVVPVPGNHYNMFHPENVGAVVTAFDRFLMGAWPASA